MNVPPSQSVIKLEVIPKLVEVLVEDGVVAADYIVQVLMCLADSEFNAEISAIVSRSQQNLDAILARVHRPKGPTDSG